jgi:hypothetical protein
MANEYVVTFTLADGRKVDDIVVADTPEKARDLAIMRQKMDKFFAR